MKKLIALLLAALMVFSMVACAGKTDTKTNTETKTEEKKEDSGTTFTGDASQDFSSESLKQTTEIDETKTYKKHIVLSLWAPLTDLHPQHMTNTIHRVYFNMVYHSPLYLDLSTAEFSGELAEDWKQIDNSTYWFKLKEGILFSNGEELEADDAKYTYELFKTDELCKVTAMKKIDYVEVNSKYEFTIHLAEPNGELLYSLYDGNWAILNREACEADPEYGYRVGTGGWTLTDFVPSDHVDLARVDSSWVWEVEGPCPTETITMKTITENSIAACQAGECANALCDYTDIIGYLNDDPNVECFCFSGFSYIYMFLNCGNPTSVFYDDLELRNAVQYAIDRETFNQFAYGGISSACKSPWGPATFGYTEDYGEPYEFNLDAAKECMAKSKHPDGCTLRIYTLASRAEQAGLVAEMLKPLGITCEITAQDSTGLANAGKTGDEYDAMFSDGTFGLNGATKKSVLTGGFASNRAGYDSEEMAALFDIIANGTTEAERLQACYDAQKLWRKEMPFVPIIYMMTGVMWHAGVTGLDWSVDTKFDWHHVQWEEG